MTASHEGPISVQIKENQVIIKKGKASITLSLECIHDFTDFLNHLKSFETLINEHLEKWKEHFKPLLGW